MRRRAFITLLGGAAAWPLAARAQQGERMPRIGVIDDSFMWEPFRQALSDLGYVPGRNISFEYRTAEGIPDRLLAAAKELARLPVDVLAVWGTPPARAAKEATATIPIVAISVGNPVRAELVAGLARPGGNITGNTILATDITPKRLQLLQEVIPSIRRVAFLWNPDNASNVAIFEEVRTAVTTLGLDLIPVAVRRADELDNGLAGILNERADAFLMTGDPLHLRNIETILRFLSKNRIPGMFQTREEVVVGGMMSYGANVKDLFRHGAGYVHKILQGAKPADLPIVQPTRFELVINLKTAQALGLTVPATLLARADEVIE